MPGLLAESNFDLDKDVILIRKRWSIPDVTNSLKRAVSWTRSLVRTGLVLEEIGL